MLLPIAPGAEGPFLQKALLDDAVSIQSGFMMQPAGRRAGVGRHEVGQRVVMSDLWVR
jgi:hypothetical protein